MSEAAMGKRSKTVSRFANYRWIPWVFVGGFLAIILANTSLIYFATKSWPGLTTDHAYNEGLAYNQVIHQSEMEAQLGWKFEISFAPRKGSLGGQVVIVARDRTGAALTDLDVRGEIVRPVEQIASIPAVFVSQGEGRYVSAIDVPRAGQWEIRFSGRRGDQTWHGGHRILVPSP